MLKHANAAYSLMSCMLSTSTRAGPARHNGPWRMHCYVVFAFSLHDSWRQAKLCKLGMVAAGEAAVLAWEHQQAREAAGRRPLSPDAAARRSPTRLQRFASAPGTYTSQHGVLDKYWSTAGPPRMQHAQTAAPGDFRAARRARRPASPPLHALPKQATGVPPPGGRGRSG